MNASVEATDNAATEDDIPFLLNYPDLDDPQGKVVLSNEHVVLQRLYVPAGEWEGVHSHPGNQIYIHIIGGEWTGLLGDEYEYFEEISPDGEVGWLDAIPMEAEHNSGNTGDNPIDLIYVTLKSDVPIDPDRKHAPQEYPDLSLQLEFENERVIVQRGFIAPRQWSGQHSRPGHQLVVTIKGGIWSEQYASGGGETTKSLEPGAVAWFDAAEGVQFGNTGESTIEFILVTIK